MAVSLSSTDGATHCHKRGVGGGGAGGPRTGEELQRLARSSAFRVRSVSVVGARRLSPATIVEIAGISGGSALLDVNVELVSISQRSV